MSQSNMPRAFRYCEQRGFPHLQSYPGRISRRHQPTIPSIAVGIAFLPIHQQPFLITRLTNRPVMAYGWVWAWPIWLHKHSLTVSVFNTTQGVNDAIVALG